MLLDRGQGVNSDLLTTPFLMATKAQSHPISTLSNRSTSTAVLPLLILLPHAIITPPIIERWRSFTMEKQSIRLTLNGRKRKEAADYVGKALGVTPVYQKAPSYAYAIGTAIIDRDGNLSFAEEANEETRNTILSALIAASFVAEPAEKLATSPAKPKAPVPEHLCIKMSLDGFTPEKLDNLCKLVASKQTLLQKTIGAEALPVALGKKTIDFPWFKVDATPEEIAAYTQLVKALCDMAKQQQRILATDKPVENEKYAFRCFLLRLGFIGEEYAETRKILLQNLSGNGSHKNGAGKPRQPEAKTEAVNGTGDSAEPTIIEEAQSPQPEPAHKSRFSFKKLLGALKVLALD